MTNSPLLVLASASPRRLALLRQIGIEPDHVEAAELSEAVHDGELPRAVAMRLAVEKANAVAIGHKGAIVLGCDTVVACGRRILGKPGDADTARTMLRLLSGRSHNVFSGVAIVGREGNVMRRTVQTSVAFKRLTVAEIECYLRSGEWSGKAGAYAIQGRAGAFVRRLSGSYSNVVGLPLFETANLLEAAGLPVRQT